MDELEEWMKSEKSFTEQISNLILTHNIPSENEDESKIKRDRKRLVRRVMKRVLSWYVTKKATPIFKPYSGQTVPDCLLEVYCKRFPAGVIEDTKYLDSDFGMFIVDSPKASPSDCWDIVATEQPTSKALAELVAKDRGFYREDSAPEYLQFMEPFYAFDIEKMAGEGVETEDSLGSEAKSGFEFDVEQTGIYDVISQFSDDLVEDAKIVFGDRAAEIKSNTRIRERMSVEAVKFLVLTGYWSSETNTPDGHEYDAGVDYLGRVTLSQISKVLDGVKQRGSGCLE